jgi:hypothetical protein
MENDIKNQNDNKDISFSEKHPRINMLIGIMIIIAGVVAAIFLVRVIIRGIGIGATQLAEAANSLDAVVIVALVTGALSITGVITSSIVAKVIEYKQKRNEYLFQKREEPYAKFIESIYKSIRNVKEKNYPDNEMMNDIFEFSQQLTLWGSNRVIKKWIKFRTATMSLMTPEEIMFMTEDILFEIRKDMGQRKMKKGNLLSFFVNDIKK